MVEKYVQIRDKLERKLFSVYGKEVTLKKKGTPILNSRDEVESYTYTESTIKIVPYNLIADAESFQDFGTVNEGDMDAAVSYDTDIAIQDQIVMEGVTYTIKAVNENYLPENVVFIIRLTKTLNAN